MLSPYQVWRLVRLVWMALIQHSLVQLQRCSLQTKQPRALQMRLELE